jgi:GNAT superfamily N-acetyltransferase
MSEPAYSVETISGPTGDDKNCITTTLVRAFDTDPVANWMLRKDDKRQEAYDLFFRTCLALCFQKGEVFHAHHYAGSALWFPPEKWKIGYIQQARLAPEMIRAVGPSRVIMLLKAIDLLEKSHPKEGHYYLHVLGVDPEHQGKGIGAALLKPILDRCDREGCGAYLENSKVRNLDFYSRQGFQVTDEIRLGKGSPPLWLMWRKPQ